MEASVGRTARPANATRLNSASTRNGEKKHGNLSAPLKVTPFLNYLLFQFSILPFWWCETSRCGSEKPQTHPAREKTNEVK